MTIDFEQELRKVRGAGRPPIDFTSELAKVRSQRTAPAPLVAPPPPAPIAAPSLTDTSVPSFADLEETVLRAQRKPLGPVPGSKIATAPAPAPVAPPKPTVPRVEELRPTPSAWEYFRARTPGIWREASQRYKESLQEPGLGGVLKSLEAAGMGLGAPAQAAAELVGRGLRGVRHPVTGRLLPHDDPAILAAQEATRAVGDPINLALMGGPALERAAGRPIARALARATAEREAPARAAALRELRLGRRPERPVAQPTAPTTDWATTEAQRLHGLATQHRDPYLADLRQVASSTGTRYAEETEQFAVKSPESAREKLLSKRFAEQRAAGQPIEDMLRQTIVIQHPDDAAKVIAELERRGYTVRQTTNRYLDLTPDYKDINLKLTKGADDPLVKEVQLITPRIFEVKKSTGHDIYQIGKRLDQLEVEVAHDPTALATLRDARRALQGHMRFLYQRAYVEDLEGPLAARSLTAPTAARVVTRSAGTPPAFLSKSEITSLRSLLKTLREPRLASRAVSGEISRGVEELIAREAPPSTPSIARRRAPTAGPVLPAVPTAPPPAPTVPSEAITLRPAGVGGQATVRTARGTEIGTQYAIVDADAIVASHDNAFRPDPRYPQGLQPRMRDRAALQNQVNSFVERLDPESLGATGSAGRGAPIVGPDGVIESGNGRTMGLRLAYAKGHPNAARYRTWLSENVAKFGLDPQSIASVKNPILVRIRTTPVDRARFTLEANEGTRATMSAVEIARADAKVMPPSTLGLFDPTAPINAASNRDFARAFLRDHVSPGDLGRYVAADGSLSQEGINRIRNAVFARAYGDITAIEKLAEAPDANLRNITAAMLDAAPRIAVMKDAIAAGRAYPLDLSTDVARAASKLSSLREESTPVSLYLTQSQLFPDDLSAEARLLVQVLDQNARSRGRIAEILNTYADRVERLGDPSQVSLLGERAVPSKLDLLKLSIQPGQEPLLGELAFAPEGPSARTPSVEAATKANLREATAQLVAEGQTGAIRFGAPAPAGAISPESTAALAAGRQREGLTITWRRIRQWVIERIHYEGILEFVNNLPKALTKDKLRNDFRLFENRVRNLIPAQVRDDLAGVVSPLTPDEHGLFQDYVWLREWNEEAQVAARQGRRPSVPFGIDPSTVQRDLGVLQGQLTPSVSAAVARHDRLMAAVQRDLVDRGILSPEDARAYYMRHFVLDYDERFGRGVGIPRRFREPFRQYAKGRVGSVRAIDTDYLRVMDRALSRVYLDNAVDGFMAQTVKAADLLPSMSEAEKVMLFGKSGRPSRTGQIVEVGGKRAVTWQYHPGNYLFPATTIDAEIVNAAVARTLSDAEIAEAVRTGARGAAALGQKRPIVLIDPVLAQRLGQFGIPTKGNLFPKVNAYTRLWKRFIIDTLGPPFQIRFFTGHLERFLFMSGDPAAITKGPSAVRIMLGEALKDNPSVRDLFLKFRLIEAGPEAEEILRFAKEQAVISSSMTGMIRRSTLADPRLRHLQGRLQQILGIPENMVSLWEGLWRVPQESIRLEKFMKDLDRIHSGQSVVFSRAIRGMEGLAPIEQAGRTARVAFIDYGARSLFEQAMGELLTPFVTFHYQNLQGWYRLARYDRTKLAIPIAIYGSMVAWNNTGDREKIESALPSWYRLMPHLITGWKTTDGRPLIVTFATASYAAARVVGLDVAGDEMVKALKGRKTIDDAVHDAATGVATGPFRAVRESAGPIVGAYETLHGRDPRTGRPIVPQRLAGTRAEKAIIGKRIFEDVFPPYGAVARTGRDVGVGQVSPWQEVLMRAGPMKAVDLEAERRRRVADLQRAAKAGIEDKLYAVEQAYLDSGGNRAVAIAEARRQNGLAGPKISADQLGKLVGSSGAPPPLRIRIELLTRRLRDERDPQRRAQIVRALHELRRQQELIMRKSLPPAVRGTVPANP